MIGLPAPLEHWTALAETLRLPVLGPSREALSRLGDGSSLRAERIARLALHDPGLALEMLRAAGARVGARPSAPALADGVETVGHAVMLLGVETALELALELPVLEVRACGPDTGVLEVLGTAHAAGSLGADWAARGGRRSPDAHRFAANAYLLGDLAAWCGAEGAALALSKLERTEREDRKGAERDVLGATRAEIGATIAASWRLSVLARDVLDPEPGRTDRAATTALAARLADITRSGWDGAEPARLLEALAARLAVEPARALGLARRGTAAAARAFHDPRLVPAARHLALAAGERIRPDWHVEPARDCAPAPPPASERCVASNDPQARRPRQDGLARCRATLRGYAAGRVPVHTAMQELVSAMATGLALDRVVLAMLGADRSVLVGRFGAGDADEPFLRRFRLELDEEHLFTQLMRQPQALVVDRRNRLAVWARLPESARTVLSEQGFFAMPVFVRDRAVGLLYADWHSRQACDRTAYGRFKQICVHTGKALEQAAARAREAAGPGAVPGVPPTPAAPAGEPADRPSAPVHRSSLPGRLDGSTRAAASSTVSGDCRAAAPGAGAGGRSAQGAARATARE